MVPSNSPMSRQRVRQGAVCTLVYRDNHNPRNMATPVLQEMKLHWQAPSMNSICHRDRWSMNASRVRFSMTAVAQQSTAGTLPMCILCRGVAPQLSYATSLPIHQYVSPQLESFPYGASPLPYHVSPQLEPFLYASRVLHSLAMQPHCFPTRPQCCLLEL